MQKHYVSSYCKQIVTFATLFAFLSNTALAGIWYVGSSADTDGAVCVVNNAPSAAACTFRDAANHMSSGDTIQFTNDVSVTDTSVGATSHTISVSNATIDGTTGGHNIDFNGNANGGGGPGASFLRVTATGFTLNGVHIYNYNGAAVTLGVNNVADSAIIHDNIFGKSSAGAGATNMYGIVNEGSSSEVIRDNVISNNSQDGILIKAGGYTANTTIDGNRIGVDGFLTAGVLDAAGGTTAIPNGGAGIKVTGGNFGMGLQIGQSLASQRNIISGNVGPAVSIYGGGGTISGNINVENNYMGLGKDGSTVIANDAGAVNTGVVEVEELGTSAVFSIINNVISGNTGGLSPIPGIAIRSGASATIQGNKIGVKADGTTAAGNSGDGVVVDAGTITVGTNGDGLSDSAEANTIANNGGRGIDNYGTETNTITIAGNTVTGNSSDGVRINSNATTVNIGSTPATSADGVNTIGGNTGKGIDIASTGGTSGTPATVTIVNNHVGTDGTTNNANLGSGIKLEATSGVSNVRIGSDGNGTNDSAERNIIGKNYNGVAVDTDGEVSVIKAVKTLVIAGNVLLGTNPTNGSHGIVINDTIDTLLTSITIGGDDCSTDAHATANSSVERNYITGVRGNGIYVKATGSTANNAALTIQCNQIGITQAGASSGNGDAGININDAGAITIKDNTIANSTNQGVMMSNGGGTAGTSLGFYGNKVGTDASGLNPAGNGLDGLSISTSTLAATGLVPFPVIIGGTTAALGNVFAASSGNAGIYIASLATATTPFKIQGNYLGVCADPYGKGTIANGNLTTCKNVGAGASINSGNPTVGGDTGNNIDTDGTLGAGNVIVNNGTNGVRLDTSGTAIISGNIMGLIKSAIDNPYNVSAGNTHAGIEVFSGSPTVTIGGTSGANVSSNRNVMASGSGPDIYFRAGSNPIATIVNNYMNTDWAGTTRVGSSGGIQIEGGSTVTVGGLSTNEGNVVVPAAGTGSSIITSSTFSGTLNVYKNIFGLDPTGTTAFSNNDMLIDINSSSATVNIGDGTAAGRNVFAGSKYFAIYVEAANAVHVLGNYIGFAADGSTSVPDATDSATLTGMGFPVTEVYMPVVTTVSFVGNLVNNLSHVGAYFKDVTPTNESTMTADNTWYTKVHASIPTYNFWQRYTGATLAASGPYACDDGYDNDGDGKIDYPTDPGCSSASDNDETDPVVARDNASGSGGGASVVVITPTVTPTTPTVTPTTPTVTPTTPTVTPTTPTVTPTPTDNVSVDNTTVQNNAEQNLKDFIITQKLNEAVNVTTDTVLGQNEVNVNLVLSQAEANTQVVNEPAPTLTPEQTQVSDALNQLSTGQNLTKSQETTVANNVSHSITTSVRDIFQKTESKGGAVPVITAVSTGGRSKVLTKKTKIQFVLDAKRAADLQDVADAKGEDTAVVSPSTVIGDNNVSALLAVTHGGRIGDPLAAEKIFFRGIIGLASQADKLDDLRPTKPQFTNLVAGIETAPKFLAWVAAPRAGEKVSIFAVDKVDPKNPKSWKIYSLGQYAVDNTYKAAVEVDMSGKMDKDNDLKRFTMVVQNDRGQGMATDVSLNKNVEMKLDTLTLINGGQVTPVDLTKSDNLLSRLGKVVFAAAETGNKDVSIVRGYAEPGTVVFVTWKSVITTSTVIADSNGYFETQVPKQLEKGDHTAFTYGYNQSKKTASSFAKVMFTKFL